MLQLIIPGIESFDDSKNEFLYGDEVRLELEHSLISLSKWETDWGVPFLSDTDKTPEQTMAYIVDMTLTENVDPEVYTRLTDEHYKLISDYINAKRTATWFKEIPGPPRRSREQITSELIYYWMSELNIPFECETWHLKRLVTLVRVVNEKNKKPQKMSRSEMAAERRALNAQRMQQLGTSG